MKLSIICVTQADAKVRPFLQHFISLAHILGAEIIFGCHGAPAVQWLETQKGLDGVFVEGQFIEEMLDPVIAACQGNYILRLDDDERCSAGLVNWLKSGEWVRRDSWFFSRRHLWPDERHCLAGQPYFPDFQVRLSVKRQARRQPKLHAAHAYPAYRAPGMAYLEHHVFLVRSRAERQMVTAKYETLRTGANFPLEQVNVVLPYDDPSLVVEPIQSPRLLDLMDRMSWWREVGETLPQHLAQELKEFRESLHAQRS